MKTSKCTQYWPSALGQHNTYGDIEVKFLKESIELDWTIRTLKVKKEVSASQNESASSVLDTVKLSNDK